MTLVSAATLRAQHAPGVSNSRALESADASLRSTATTFEGGTSVAGGFVDTGADTCDQATVVPIGVGQLGSPVETTISTVVVGGDANDCLPPAIWWEAISLPIAATVTLELCGTDPSYDAGFPSLIASCTVDPPQCSPGITPTSRGSGGPNCADANPWAIYQSLPAGVYFVPLRLTRLIGGEYTLTVRAEETTGACCDRATGTCTEDVASSSCDGALQQFSAGGSCCNVDCVLDGETYASDGVRLLSHVPLSEFPNGQFGANEGWGYVSPSGREYGIISLQGGGTGYVEITDPLNPRVVGSIPDSDISLWRDLAIVGEYAYSLDEFSGGIQIMDLRQIDNGVVTEAGRFQEGGLTDAHNIVSNEASQHIFTCGANLGVGGLLAFDVSDPENPVFTGAWDEAYIHDAYIETFTEGPNAGREIAFGFCQNVGLCIIDVTDKANMTTLGLVQYPSRAVNHQGWISEDKRYIVFGDEGDEFSGATTRTYVANIEDLNNPFLANTYSNGQCSIDHNLMIQGDLVYLSNYSSGLRVYDFSAPPALEEVAYFDTFPQGNFVAFVGAWGIYANFPSGHVLVSDIESGMFVLTYDCNKNNIPDADEIANQTVDDCNANGIPDSCEFDCNENSIPDECDIAEGTLIDADGNGLADLCECGSIAPPALAEGYIPGNRYLTVQTGSPGVETALMVTMDSLHDPSPPPSGTPDFSSFNGSVRWVGPPEVARESQNPSPTFVAAKLQCEPFVHDWGSLGEVSVYGAEVLPSSTYTVQAVRADCLENLSPASLSAPQVVTTGYYGDVVPPFAFESELQPDINDVLAVVDKLLGLESAPVKARAQMQPNEPIPDQPVVIGDVLEIVDSFLGNAYPYSGPSACP